MLPASMSGQMIMLALPGHLAGTRDLLGRHLRREGRVELELAVDLEIGTLGVGDGDGVPHLVDEGALGASRGGVGEQGAARLPAQKLLHRVARRDGDAGQVFLVGVHTHGAVPEGQQLAFGPLVSRYVGDPDAGYGGDAFPQPHDHLPGQDHIAGGVGQAREGGVDPSQRLQDQGGVERIATLAQQGLDREHGVERCVLLT